MKKVLYLCLAALLVSAAFGQEFQMGSAVKDFTLSNVEGKPVQFSSLKGDITVIMFIATKCPISNDYNERMKAVYSDYHGKGVKFVAINPNSTEPAEEVKAHTASNGFQFAVYKDPNNVVADRFGAEFTPEVFVLDKTSTMRYHGHIDDSRNAANIKVQGLRKALDALLAGQPVDPQVTKAFGCTIKRVKKVS